MPLALPDLRVGEPICHEALSVFPLFSDADESVHYKLSDAALADNSLLVEEVDNHGSVPDLLVENKGDMRVLFLEGEELIGAKQNRVLNTSVLVAPHSKLKIPVSCVEQGRWRRQSRYFGSSGSHSPTKLRRALKKSVSESVKARQSHASDQGEVWKEVENYLCAFNVPSKTGAMSDAFDGFQEQIETYRQSINYVKGASGFAVAIGDKLVALDLFDKPSTCEKVWARLLSGVVFDALEAGKTDHRAGVSNVEQLIADVAGLRWEQSPAIGEGEEFRAESTQGDHASALALAETVVHGSIVAAP